jgi:hypothetical protein
MISISATPDLHPQVATRSVEGQALVVLADTGEVAILNETGTFLWEQVDGNCVLSDLASTLALTYGISLVDAESDTLEFFEALLAMDAIVL